MKIAVISMIRDSWGGSEELWYDMAKVALAQGHHLVHLSYEHKPLHPKLKELIALGLIAIHRPGITDANLKGLNRFARLAINYARKKIHDPIKKLFDQKPDVVLYNGTCYSIAGEKQLLKKLETFRGRFFLIGHFNEKEAPVPNDIATITKAYERAEKVLFTNYNDIRNANTQLGYEIRNALVVRNPVNMQDKTLVPFPSSTTMQMAMVANLVTVHKGQDIVLNILKGRTWRERNWQLNVYGDGPDKNFLKTLCEKNELTNKIVFHGRVDDIRGLWKKNHILLMPSRMEGMPLAVVEAMLCGRTCVATNVGGIAEWIEEDRSGFIAKTATEDSFGMALEKAWQHREIWEEMGRQAHERALQLYDPQPGKTLLALITK